ncbi:MAG TPA: hypothetical protein VFO46_02380 [Candidatus Sulfotelmatobacter sp.]|nr:hypothetical protein [Candidatus Sulfotelmatobacter sp.]
MFAYRIWDSVLESFRRDVYRSREEAEYVAKALNEVRAYERYIVYRV